MNSRACTHQSQRPNVGRVQMFDDSEEYIKRKAEEKGGFRLIYVHCLCIRDWTKERSWTLMIKSNKRPHRLPRHRRGLRLFGLLVLHATNPASYFLNATPHLKALTARCSQRSDPHHGPEQGSLESLTRGRRFCNGAHRGQLDDLLWRFEHFPSLSCVEMNLLQVQNSIRQRLRQETHVNIRVQPRWRDSQHRRKNPRWPLRLLVRCRTAGTDKPMFSQNGRMRRG